MLTAMLTIAYHLISTVILLIATVIFGAGVCDAAWEFWDPTVTAEFWRVPPEKRNRWVIRFRSQMVLVLLVLGACLAAALKLLWDLWF